jgi:hypothetical protein
MTVLVGTHVHELSAPEIDLVVDRVAELPDGHELLRAVDADGHQHYVAAADTEQHGRHRRPEDIQPQPVTGGSTISGLVRDAHMGLGWFGGAR